MFYCIIQTLGPADLKEDVGRQFQFEIKGNSFGNRKSVKLFSFFLAIKIGKSDEITLNTNTKLKLVSTVSHTPDDDKIKILQNIDNINMTIA